MKFFLSDRCPVVQLDQNELAQAIRAYLLAHGVAIVGPNTVRVRGTSEDGEDPADARVIVDSSGKLLTPEGVDVAEASARQDAFAAAMQVDRVAFVPALCACCGRQASDPVAGQRRALCARCRNAGCSPGLRAVACPRDEAGDRA